MYYKGNFESPRTPKIEEAIMVLDGTLTNGVNSLLDSLEKIKEEIEKSSSETNTFLKTEVGLLKTSVAELRAKIDR
jgi:hypothetical protein